MAVSAHGRTRLLNGFDAKLRLLFTAINGYSLRDFLAKMPGLADSREAYTAKSGTANQVHALSAK